MGSKKRPPTPPPAPSPERIAQTDARFNRIDQFTPFGSLTFSGPDRNQANLELSPELDRLFNLQTQSDTNLLRSALQAQGGIEGLIRDPLSTQGLPELQFGLDAPTLQGLSGVNLTGSVDPLDFSGAAPIPESADAFRDEITDAFFDRTSGLLNRQFDRNENRLRQRLANQGFQAGSEGFSQELGDFDIQRNDAFSRLANDAVLFGGREASRSLADQLALRGTGTGEALSQFGAGLQGAQFGNQSALSRFGVNQDVINQGNQNALLDLQNQAFVQDRSNTARSQLFNEEAALRGNQFNELASLLGLQQVQTPGLNNFFSPGQTNVNDAFALQQAALNNQFTTNSDRASAAKGGTAGLIGTLGGAAIAGPFGSAIGNALGQGFFGRRPGRG